MYLYVYNNDYNIRTYKQCLYRGLLRYCEVVIVDVGGLGSNISILLLQ